MIRAITFDVDGTLTDAKALRWPMLWRNWHRLRVLRVGMRVREELRRETFASGAAMRTIEAERVAARLDCGVDTARKALDAVFDASMTAALRGQPVADVRAALQQLRARGIAIAAISDRRIDDKLMAIGLHDLPWVARISADDVGVLKPHTALMSLACAQLHVQPSEVVHVGDRDDTDGALARACGARFVLVAGPRAIPAALETVLGGR